MRCRALAPDQWFVGYRFNERESGGYPTLAELDAAAGGRPLFILRTDAHLGLANSKAFAACAITSATPDPAFGKFDRNSFGGFTGLVRETAAHVFLSRIHENDTEEEIASGLAHVFSEAFSYGITTLYNSLTPSKAMRAYQTMKRDGRLPMRIGVIASGREAGLVEALIAAGVKSGFGDDNLRLIGVEWCPDCSTSGRTAAYYEPYIGTRIEGEPEDNRGMLLYEADDLNSRAIAAHKAGLQVMIEGVGDRGIDFALDAIEAALDAHPAVDHRMRVEHCCHVTPAILERLLRLRVVDSSATGFMYELGDAYVANRGAAAMRHMWPHRTLIDAGVPAPGHSDAAVCSANPWTAMWAMVNRRSRTGTSLDSAEAVSAREALAAYTTLGAWSGFEETYKGTLEVGKLADVAVLDRDPIEVSSDEIRAIMAIRTFVGGKEVYCRG